MASLSQVIIFLLLFSLIWKTHNIIAEDPSYVVGDDDNVALKIQLDFLNSKISILESNFEAKVNELRTKDDSINQMAKIIQEKSATIDSLQNDMQAVCGIGDADDTEQVGKAQALINELETQRIGDEQKTRIHKTEHALEGGEEEMMKAKLRETKICEELEVVRQSWVPHWLSVHLFHCQSFLSTHWKESGRPVLDATLQKVLQKKAELGKLATPHIETVKTKWLPVTRDQFTRLDSQIELRVKLLATKISEVYHASKKSIKPHLEKLLEIVDPYFQKWVLVMKDQFTRFVTQIEPRVKLLTTKTSEVCQAFKILIEPLLEILLEIVVSDFQELKKFTKPYVDQAVTVTKPHLDNGHILLKLYTEKLTSAYKKLVNAFHLYHLQLQPVMREILMKTVLSRPLASEKMVWLSVSSLMAVPVIILFDLVIIIRKRPKRRRRNSGKSHSRLRQSKKKREITSNN